MTVLQRTLAILAFLALSAQIVRHAYILWFEPPLKGQITNARSLQELINQYEPIHKQAEQARLQNAGSDQMPDFIRNAQIEPFKSETMLQNAIKDWEAKSKEVYSLKFYCIVGLFCLVFGTAIFKWGNQWVGFTLQVAAFSEFIYWTSPTFLGTALAEFDRLLAYKLAFSVISLLLLLFTIWIQGIFTTRRPAASKMSVSV
jgi:hypothetical protein